MTQKEIAEALGVSRTTVSRALSGKGRISEETRQKILKYEKDNSPSENTGIPITYNLGVVLPADNYINSNTYFSECLYGICEAASYQKYNVLIVKATETDISEIKNVVEGRKVDALILTRCMENDKALQYLENKGFPVGLTGQYNNDKVIQVDIDNEGATQEIMTLMIAKGFRHFALILEDIDYLVNRKRYNGFMQAVLKSGLPECKQYIRREKIKGMLLENFLRDIMSNKTECIVCGDDELCARMMSWLQGEGYRIPNDIMILSLFNSPTLNMMHPSVTAIDVPARMVGKEIGRQMCHFLQNEEYQKKTLINYEILIRKSTSR